MAQSLGPQRPVWKWILYSAALLGISLVCAESTARLDDWMRFGTGCLETSSMDSLVLREVGFRRGRPDSGFRHWKLNEHGFRGPSFRKEKEPGKTRVMLLGASETFGTHESPGKSYPEVLATNLPDSYQVINTALVGMPLAEMVNYWDLYLAQYQPDILVLCASPLFYLADQAPMIPSVAPLKSAPARPPAIGWVDSLRFIERLRNRLSLPALVVEARDRAKLARTIESKDAGWVFEKPPEDRLELYQKHLTMMIDRTEKASCQLVLITQPIRVAMAIRPEDEGDLLAARMIRPRATERTLVDFSSLARDRLMALADSRSIPVVDLWEVMAGDRALFHDIVHFSDRGAQIAAQRIAQQLIALEPAPHLSSQ
jgi:hypothetical protein